MPHRISIIKSKIAERVTRVSRWDRSKVNFTFHIIPHFPHKKNHETKNEVYQLLRKETLSKYDIRKTMGKITVFTSNDLNSKIVTNALTERKLPYTEISLEKYPDKVSDVQALTGSKAVPKIFFNTRSVTGTNDILKEFLKWDISKQYKTPFDKYMKEIAILPDPKKKAFDISSSLPLSEPETNVGQDSKMLIVNQLLPVVLMTDPTLSYIDIMEELKVGLPLKDIQKNGTFYKNVCTGDDVCTYLSKYLSITRDISVKECNQLIIGQVIHCVTVSSSTKKPAPSFVDSKDVFYRLQSYTKPSLLNGYHMRRKRKSACNPIQLVSYLFSLMNRIHMDSVDTLGMLDCEKCIVHRFYPKFEFAICELQNVTFLDMNDRQRIAFGINIYRLMKIFALIKIGVPFTESDREHFLTKVKIMVGGYTFTFVEWLDGIIRGNKARTDGKIAFADSDPRAKLGTRAFDPCIHFALNVGSFAGRHCSAPFTEYTADNLQYELSTASQVFFEDPTNIAVDVRKNTVHVINTLGQYKNDFGSSNRDIEFLSKLEGYMTGPSRLQLAKMIGSKRTKLVWNECNCGSYLKNYRRYESNADLLKTEVKGIKAIIRRFRAAPTETPKESDRINALRQLKVLDTTSEERFDQLTRTVQEELSVPIALISLVDVNRQWFKSKQWICPTIPVAPTETPRDISFCGHAILQNEIMIINDATLDSRFADNPFVTGDLKLRFYAGVPLRVSDDNGTLHNIGTLCVIDFRPRELNDTEINLLNEYADKIKRELVRQFPLEETHYFM